MGKLWETSKLLFMTIVRVVILLTAWRVLMEACTLITPSQNLKGDFNRRIQFYSSSVCSVLSSEIRSSVVDESPSFYAFKESIFAPLPYDVEIRIQTNHLGYTSVVGSKGRRKAKDGAISSFNRLMNPQWNRYPPEDESHSTAPTEIERDIQKITVSDYPELSQTYGPLCDITASVQTPIVKFEDYEHVSFVSLFDDKHLEASANENAAAYKQAPYANVIKMHYMVRIHYERSHFFAFKFDKQPTWQQIRRAIFEDPRFNCLPEEKYFLTPHMESNHFTVGNPEDLAPFHYHKRENAMPDLWLLLLKEARGRGGSKKRDVGGGAVSKEDRSILSAENDDEDEEDDDDDDGSKKKLRTSATVAQVVEPRAEKMTEAEEEAFEKDKKRLRANESRQRLRLAVRAREAASKEAAASNEAAVVGGKRGGDDLDNEDEGPVTVQEKATTRQKGRSKRPKVVSDAPGSSSGGSGVRGGSSGGGGVGDDGGGGGSSSSSGSRKLTEKEEDNKKKAARKKELRQLEKENNPAKHKADKEKDKYRKQADRASQSSATKSKVRSANTSSRNDARDDLCEEELNERRDADRDARDLARLLLSPTSAVRIRDADSDARGEAREMLSPTSVVRIRVADSDARGEARGMFSPNTAIRSQSHDAVARALARRNADEQGPEARFQRNAEGRAYRQSDVGIATRLAYNVVRRENYVKFPPHESMNGSWDYDHPCRYCAKVWLKKTSALSRRRCCQSGKFVGPDSPIPSLNDWPPEIYEMIKTDQSHFSRTSALYNSILALGATAVDNGRDVGWERISGSHAVTLNGRTHHFIPSVRRHEEASKGGGIEYFIYDQCTSAIAHGAAKNVRTGSAAVQKERNIDPEYMTCFYLQLREHNPLYERLYVVGQRLQNIIDLNNPNIDTSELQVDFDPALLMGNETNSDMIAYMNEGEAAMLDVASVSNIHSVGERVIRIRSRDDGGNWSQIKGTSAQVEPLSYPLFFFCGEDGWGKEIRKEVSFNSYICARLLMPERGMFARSREESYDPRGINTNRFVLLSRCGQTWLCDSVSRSIDYSLNWHTMNQAYIFGESSAALQEEGADLNAGVYGADGNGEAPEDHHEPLNGLNEGGEIEVGVRGVVDQDVGRAREVHADMEAEWEDDYGQGHGPGQTRSMRSELAVEEVGAGGGAGGGGGGGADDVDEHDDVMINGILNQAEHPDSPGLRVESKANFLSDSFHGSRRHLRKLAVNALVIITQRDTPHLFITFTCNQDWPEITSRLLEHTEAFDNPALVAEVFHAKLHALTHNLRTGKYFRDNATDSHSRHRVAYQMYVVEYQHRGLPHAHIVCRLTNIPEEREGMLAWIKKHIRAVMPREGENVDCPAYEKYSLASRRAMVEKKMKHTCYGKGDMAHHATCRNKDGMCKKGFDNMVMNENEPSFDAKGFPAYGRVQDEDLKIVSYEMSMLMDVNCHCNVEWCGSNYTCVYLYKYIFKGSKKERFRLKNADDIIDEDEKNLYLRARMISSMDAAWRVLGYHTYPSTNPAVTLVKVQTPEEVTTFTDNPDPVKYPPKLTDLYVYFNRPRNIEFTDPAVFGALEIDHGGKNMDELKYTEFFDLYTYNKKLPKWHSKRPEMQGKKWWLITFPNGIKNYVFKRQDPYMSIVRMQMLYSKIGEKYWVRCLLLNRSCRSFESLRTNAAGEICAKFQQCAQELGFASEEQEALLCFNDAMMISTPPELRCLFISLTVQGLPTLQLYYDDVKRTAMMLDFQQRYTPEEVLNGTGPENDLLLDFADRLLEMSKNLGMYGLPFPTTGVMTELELEQARYNIGAQLNLLAQLNQSAPNNPEQQAIFDRIKDAVTNRESTFIYVQGPAGSGKTTLAKKIMAYVRSIGRIALGCATTNLAACNFENFYSMHSLFGLPVLTEDEVEDSVQLECRLDSKPQRQDLIHAASLILIDEFPGVNRNCFEACCRQFNNFQGKVIVCFGDFRQTSPIVTDGTISDSIDACIQSSRYWQGMQPATEKKFEIHKLQINMRLEMLNIAISAKVFELDAQIEDVNNIDDIERQRLIVLRDDCKIDFDKQVAYAKLLLQIGNGQVMFSQEDDPNIELIDLDEENSTSSLCLSNIMTFTQVDRETITEQYLLDHPELLTPDDIVLLDGCNEDPALARNIKRKNDLLQLKFKLISGKSKRDALTHLYPDGFDVIKMQKRSILATTNVQVDMWNEIIQEMNPNNVEDDSTLCRVYLSKDELGEVDDPRDVISQMLSEEILNEATSKEAPPHSLKLAVSDICYLMFNLSRKDRLAKNTRVRIIALRQYAIRVQTCGANPTCHWIPRIKFKFSLRYGSAYELTRTQFPLRLAYAVSVNKSQGQEYDEVLFDVTEQPFAHGQSYVAMSRIRRFDTIKIYIGENSLSTTTREPVVTNVVYPELIKCLFD